jgi:hypothetical protein
MRRRTSIRAAALAACAVTVALGVSMAGAAKTTILGAAKPAKASCPENCLVEAKVTGYQMAIGNIKNPFVVPRKGEIVAWSIKLGKPRKPDRKSFNREFGSSRARISILRKVPKTKRPPRFKLLRQSPVENLGPFFGSTTTFSLTRPLAVRKKDVVALTIPSWAPAFAVGQPMSTRWRASRRATEKRGGCTVEGGFANVAAGGPQQKKGTQRPYGCVYDTARLLYSATFVQP